MYRYYNANSHKLLKSDCVIRAISVCEGMTWEQCHRKLSYLSEKDGTLLDDAEFVENYLDDRYPRLCFRGFTVKEFADKCPKGNYVLSMKGHVTAVIDNVIVDTFDCSKRIFDCSWKVK